MYKYVLPTGGQIDAERLSEAALSKSEYPQTYLDTVIGKLVKIDSPEHLGEWVSEIGATNRYMLIEPFSDTDRNENAKHFIKLMQITDPKRITGARRAFDNGGWQAFEGFLSEHTDGWIDGWNQWINDAAWQYVHDWLTHMPHVPIRAVFEGSDGCAMCELARKGEDGDIEKLTDAFAVENTMRTVAQQISGTKEHAHTQARGQKTMQKEGTKGFVFKITLNDSKPRIWRRIIVPANYTFFDLHCAIQDAMGWTDSHLHAFRLDTRSQPKAKRPSGSAKIISIELPNPEMDAFDAVSSKDEREEKIADWFPARMKQCTYEYDFGDGWTHTIAFEREMPLTKGEEYPQCVAGKNACPPDDCGGLGGYDNLQEILKDPKHEEHEDMLEWLCIDSPEEFDPSRFDLSEIEFIDPVERLKEYEMGFGL